MKNSQLDRRTMKAKSKVPITICVIAVLIIIVIPSWLFMQAEIDREYNERIAKVCNNLDNPVTTLIVPHDDGTKGYITITVSDVKNNTQAYRDMRTLVDKVIRNEPVDSLLKICYDIHKVEVAAGK